LADEPESIHWLTQELKGKKGLEKSKGKKYKNIKKFTRPNES
jgi:hypothetical protein